MMMMRRMIVVVHAWCLRIEPVRGLAFTSLSLRACTLAPLSASLITDCAKLFDWSAMTNCLTGIAIWKTACCIVWGKCKMQQKVFVKTVWETRLSKIVWGIVWKLFETRFWGNVIYKACHKLFPMNKINTMTNVSLIKITENFNGGLLVPLEYCHKCCHPTGSSFN